MTKAERTKKFIIERVSPIFNKKGVSGTSLSDITSATGLTKGAVYGNFEDKDTLAKACFEHNLRFLQKGLYKSIATTGSAYHKLNALLRFYLEHYNDVASNGGCPLMNSAIEADDANPLLKQKVKYTMNLWEKELIGILNDSIEKSEISDSIEPKKFSRQFIAAIEGGILLAKSMEDPSYFQEVIEGLQNQLEQVLK